MIQERLDGDTRTSEDGNAAQDICGNLDDLGEFGTGRHDPLILLPHFDVRRTLAPRCEAPRLIAEAGTLPLVPSVRLVELSGSGGAKEDTIQ